MARPTKIFSPSHALSLSSPLPPAAYHGSAPRLHAGASHTGASSGLVPPRVRTLHGSMPAHLECGASMPARLGFGRAALPTTTSPHRRHPQAPVPHPSKLDPERSLELLPRIPLAGEVDIHRFRPLLGKSSRLKTRICEAGSCCKSECAVVLICSYISFEGSLRVSCSSFVQFALMVFDKWPV